MTNLPLLSPHNYCANTLSVKDTHIVVNKHHWMLIVTESTEMAAGTV